METVRSKAFAHIIVIEWMLVSFCLRKSVCAHHKFSLLAKYCSSIHIVANHSKMFNVPSRDT